MRRPVRQRLADRADLVERREEIAAIGLDEGLGMHLLDVDASGKRLFVAGDDDGTDGRIALERLERPVELADELRVERVQRVRAVQRNEPDLALARDDDRLVGVGVARVLLFPADWFGIHIDQFPSVDRLDSRRWSVLPGRCAARFRGMFFCGMVCPRGDRR